MADQPDRLSQAIRRRLAEQRVERERLEEADEALVEQLIEWLDEKWGDRACPYCDTDEWVVGSTLLGLPVLRGEGVVPHFVVTCENCGQSVFIPLEAAGLWPEGGPGSPGS